MSITETQYGLGVAVERDFAETVELTREELAREGFGIITEVDISATLKAKLGVDYAPYVILGACNPPLAHRALEAEREIGLLLPCNVIVYDDGVPGETRVSAMNPEAALEIAGNDQISGVAREVRVRMERVLDRLERAR